MTAIKPIENRRVTAVASERYPLNKKSSAPNSTEDATDPHHCFPRSLIKGDSWFVQIIEDDGYTVIPHVTGLSRDEHERVERGEVWIRYNVDGDGVWSWWERNDGEDLPVVEPTKYAWVDLGPLNPQPGSVEGKPKRPRLKGEARRKRKTISIRVPDDSENGADLWDELVDDVKAKLVKEGLYEEGAAIPIYEALFAALTDWRNG